MMTARKIFGSANDGRVRSHDPRVARIAALETELEKLSDEQLRARTDQFRKQVAEGKGLDGVPRHRPDPTRQET
jgi:preprotein translocase subunit SecA